MSEYISNREQRAHLIGVHKWWEVFSDVPWPHVVTITPHDLRTHAHVIGATGYGKTNLLHHLIAQDIHLRHSFVVLDLRGDLVSAVIEMCAGRVDPSAVKVLDLRDSLLGRLGFNPLAGAGKPYFRALNFLEVISSEAESWGVQLAETLRNALLLLAEAGEPATELESLFYNPTFLLQCLSKCTTVNVLTFWQRFTMLSQERREAMASPVLNKVSLLLATDSLRETLSHPSPLDLGKHLNHRPNILLASLAVDETHAAGRMLGRLLLSSVCREIFARVNIPEKKRNPVRLYVDEFEQFGFGEFETILAEGRKFGFSLVLAHQTLAQLNPKTRSIVLNNVGVKVDFRVGREDGAVLSRDLTGDAKTFDFAEFPVGEAVFWKRGAKPIQIEVSEPILKDSASRSSAGKKFLHEVFEEQRRANPLPNRYAQPLPGPDMQALPHLSLPALPSQTAAQEDWLCE